MAEIKITWKKSCIGFPSKQARIVAALGLKRLHHTVTHYDTPTIMGMVNKISHLLEVEKVSGENTKTQAVPTATKSVQSKPKTAQSDDSVSVNDSLNSLELSGRTLNNLNKADITSIAQVSAMSDKELLNLPGFGQKSLEEVKDKIKRG